jgi:hypothetical protein
LKIQQQQHQVRNLLEPWIKKMIKTTKPLKNQKRSGTAILMRLAHYRTHTSRCGCGVDKRFWFETTTHQVATATDTQKYMFFIVGRLVKYKISSGQCDKKEKDANPKIYVFYRGEAGKI